MPYSRSFLGAIVAGLILNTDQSIANPSPTDASYSAQAVSMSTNSSSQLDIQQQQQHAIIDWQNYQLTSGDYVNYTSASNTGQYHLLNRINSGSASLINGTITSSPNQILYFVNSNGLVIGPSGHFNVGGLVLSGLDISNQNFLDQNLVFHNANTGSAGGKVINSGNIIASMGGVVMQGGYVINDGTITATQTHVHLAAGDVTTLSFDNDGLFELEINQAVTHRLDNQDNAVSNTGEIEANGGTVTLSAKTAANLFSMAVNNQGVIEAHSLGNAQGKIQLLAEGGDIRAAGTLNVSATNAEDGGRIEVTTDKTVHLGQAGGMTTHLRANGGQQAGAVIITGEQVIVDGKTQIQTSGDHRENRVQINAQNGIHVNADLETNAEATLNADSDANGQGDLWVASGHHVITNDERLVTVANDIHLDGSLDSGQADTVLTVSDGGVMRIGQGSGDYHLDQNEIGHITANNLYLGKYIQGLENVGTIIFDGVSSNNFSNITGTLTAYGQQIKFLGHASSFTNLDALADDGIEIAKDISTTNGRLFLDADTDGNGSGNINVTHHVTLSAPKSIAMSYSSMSGFDNITFATPQVDVQLPHLSIMQVQASLPVAPSRPVVPPATDPVDPPVTDPVDPPATDPTGAIDTKPATIEPAASQADPTLITEDVAKVNELVSPDLAQKAEHHIDATEHEEDQLGSTASVITDAQSHDLPVPSVPLAHEPMVVEFGMIDNPAHSDAVPAWSLDLSPMTELSFYEHAAMVVLHEVEAYVANVLHG